MKANKNQLDLFGVNDTPLWSGAPVRVKDSEYIPERKDEAGQQSDFMDTPIPEVDGFTCPECGVGILPLDDSIYCMGRRVCLRCADCDSSGVTFGEEHYYPDDGRIIIVSRAALDDKQANWHEISGAAFGYAVVTHKDWVNIANYYEMKLGSYRLIGCKLDDGTLVHFGSINISRGRGGAITLEG